MSDGRDRLRRSPRAKERSAAFARRFSCVWRPRRRPRDRATRALSRPRPEPESGARVSALPRAPAEEPPVLARPDDSYAAIADELLGKVLEPPRWLRPALLITF